MVKLRELPPSTVQIEWSALVDENINSFDVIITNLTDSERGRLIFSDYTGRIASTKYLSVHRHDSAFCDRLFRDPTKRKKVDASATTYRRRRRLEWVSLRPKACLELNPKSAPLFT